MEQPTDFKEPMYGSDERQISTDVHEAKLCSFKKNIHLILRREYFSLYVKC